MSQETGRRSFLELAAAAPLALLTGEKAMDDGSPTDTIAAVTARFGTLGAEYDVKGPKEMLSILGGLERSVGLARKRESRTQHGAGSASVQALLFNMHANALNDLGYPGYSLAISAMALEAARVGGNDAARAHAMVIRADSRLATHRPEEARKAAVAAQAYAAGTPIMAMALLSEAETLRYFEKPNADKIAKLVAAADDAHKVMPPETWGYPGGGSLGTYHRVNMCNRAAAILSGIPGLGDRVDRWLGEAKEIVPIGSGEDILWHLIRARREIDRGDLGAVAYNARIAVAMAKGRPTAWVAQSIENLRSAAPDADLQSLIDETSTWIPAQTRQ